MKMFYEICGVLLRKGGTMKSVLKVSISIPAALRIAFFALAALLIVCSEAAKSEPVLSVKDCDSLIRVLL